MWYARYASNRAAHWSHMKHYTVQLKLGQEHSLVPVLLTSAGADLTELAVKP